MVTANCGTDGECKACAEKRLADNDANFASEEQRRYMWSQEPDIAESWAHGEHTSDKDHKMPEGPGPGVKGPMAKAARKAKRATTNEEVMTFNHRKSLWQKLGEALGITTNAPQPRHPNLGQYQGKADKSANAGYASHRGDVKPIGDQRAKDGRDMSTLEHEEQDDTDPNDIDDLGDQQADDHQNPSGSPANLRTAAKKVGINSNPEGHNQYSSGGGSSAAAVKQYGKGLGRTLDTQISAEEKFPVGSKVKSDTGEVHQVTGHSGSVVHASKVKSGGALGKESDFHHSKLTKVDNAMPLPPQTQPLPAHDVTKQAAGASLATEHAPAFGHAQTAMASSSEGDSTAAAKSHGFAAKQHEKQATGAIQEGDEAGADQHLQAAALHRKAAAMHSATRNQRGDNVPKVTTNMPAGGAFEGAKAAGYSASQAAAMAGKAEGSYEGTGGKSGEAHEASQHAERTKSAGAHRKAAAAHKEAAESHEEERPDLAKEHKSAAATHLRKAAKATRNEATINSLVENGHLHPASVEEALATLNTSDESGSGSETVQAGGEEDDEDANDMDGEDVSTVGAKKLTGKKTMNTAQWLAEAPPEVQSVVRNAMTVERNTKVRLIRRLTANCQSDQVRNRLTKVLQSRTLDELRIMASGMAPVENSNGFDQPGEGSPLFLGAGGSGFDYQQPTANAADNDILPLPETFQSRAAQ